MAGTQVQITSLGRETSKLLQDRVTWVTGAARGIGRAIALALAKAGSNIAFTYRDSVGPARELEEEIEACGVNAWGVQQDVIDIDGTRKVFEQIMHRFGKLD